MLLLVGAYTIDMDADTPGKARGIAAYDFSTRQGALTFRGYVPTVNPSYLWIDGPRQLVYAVRECPDKDDPGVEVFRVERAAGHKVHFTKVSEVSLHGDHPCHLTGVADTLIVCCYTSGTVHVFRKREDGSLGQEIQSFELPRVGSDRQPHAHCAAYDHRRERVYICDLGSDRLRVFERQADGSLQLLSGHGVAFPQGAGPRHIALHPSGDYAVVICELRGVTTLVDLREDTPRLVSSTPYLPERVADRASGAAIRMDAQGKNVYVSDRTFSVITHLRLTTEPAKYVSRDTVPSGGERPRDVCLSPDGHWLLTGNLKDHRIGVFRIGSGGALQLYHVVQKVPSPTCLKWLDI